MVKRRVLSRRSLGASVNVHRGMERAPDVRHGGCLDQCGWLLHGSCLKDGGRVVGKNLRSYGRVVGDPGRFASFTVVGEWC